MLGAVRTLAVAPNRNYFVSGSMDGSLKIFDFVTLKEIGTILAHSGTEICFY
jgi:WD40 repeat protein